MVLKPILEYASPVGTYMLLNLQTNSLGSCCSSYMPDLQAISIYRIAQEISKRLAELSHTVT